ncbi:MAG: hypothetical protein NUW01_05230 [Gemmatimonadaceae bacterium]|nr:hypothetical protein [Gemmatimonadaceae bacterium]
MEVTRPSTAEVAAAASVLREFWDHDGRFVAGDAVAYAEWGFGIADMVKTGAPFDAFPKYLSVLEEQLGYPASAYENRKEIAQRLIAAVKQVRHPG